jgi:hypothetical protein
MFLIDNQAAANASVWPEVLRNREAGVERPIHFRQSTGIEEVLTGRGAVLGKAPVLWSSDPQVVGRLPAIDLDADVGIGYLPIRIRARGIHGVLKDVADLEDLVEIDALTRRPRRVELERVVEVIPAALNVDLVSWGNRVKPPTQLSDGQLTAPGDNPDRTLDARNHEVPTVVRGVRIVRRWEDQGAWSR